MAADVPVLEEAPARIPESSRPRPPRRRRRQWAWAAVGVLLFGGLLAGVIANEVQASNRHDAAHASLLGYRYGVALVVADLTGVRHQLAALDGQVGSASVALTQDEAELKAAETALSNARSHVSQQSTMIGALHLCLGGVEQALTALSVNDQSPAIAALNSVSASCKEVAGSGG